ncbi:6-phosphofructokinase [Agromyces bauzanensis]
MTLLSAPATRRIGLLTSGGDCPGLNAVIRSAHIRATRAHGAELVGFRNGWRGILDEDLVAIDDRFVEGIGGRGGTVLGSSRTNPLEGGSTADVTAVLERHGIDGLIAVGGEGSLSAAKTLADGGVPIVGVPKTIDNDLGGTDYTFGFDTAVQIATDAMDRLLTTGESHGRCMVAEVMGRNAGWIALNSGIAVGAHGILVPEHPASLETIVGWVRSARDRGRGPLIVVAEGFGLPDGQLSVRGHEASGRPRLGGIGEALAPMIERATGVETRAATLGHIQRGGTPSAYDRVLASRFGSNAVDAVIEQKWGSMVSLRGTDIVTVPLAMALAGLKLVSTQRYERAAYCFG